MMINDNRKKIPTLIYQDLSRSAQVRFSLGVSHDDVAIASDVLRL